MSKTVSISVTKRDDLGSSNARRIRRAGNVPAVVYGHGQEASAITLTAADASKVIGHAGLVELAFAEGASKMTIVKSVQHHPINPGVVHVDFQEVKMDEKIVSTVPVVSVGEAAGTKQGGQLEQVLMELQVESLPADMPEEIVVDVTELGFEKALHVKDIVLPEGVTAVSEADLIVFHVRAPKQEAEPEAAPAEAEEGAAAADAPEAEKK